MQEKSNESVPWKQDSKGGVTEGMRRNITLKESETLMFLEDVERHCRK